MRAARKTSPLGVAAPGVPFPLSCRHHDGRLRRARAVLFTLSPQHVHFSPLRILRTTLGSTLWFVLVVWTYCRGGIGHFVARLFLGYVAFFVFLVLGVWTQLNF